MTLCDKCVCHNCGLVFYYPTDINPTDATLDHFVVCPKSVNTWSYDDFFQALGISFAEAQKAMEEMAELLRSSRNSNDEDLRLAVKKNVFNIKKSYFIDQGKYFNNHKKIYVYPRIINRTTYNNHSNFRDKKEVIREGIMK